MLVYILLIFGEVVHQIQYLIFASQQRNVRNFSFISSAEKTLLSAAQAIKNDKQINFTELSFQTFSTKFVTTIQYPKPIS